MNFPFYDFQVYVIRTRPSDPEGLGQDRGEQKVREGAAHPRAEGQALRVDQPQGVLRGDERGIL